MSTAPNTDNYYIGKGIVYFKKEGETDWRDLGNVPEFEFTPELEKLEHFSSRQGVKEKDATKVTEKKGTLRIVMDEWDFENVALALLGTVAQNTEGQNVAHIFAENSITGQIKFIGQNEVGPRVELIFNKVDFIPSSSINPISDEWGTLEVTGEVAAVNGDFGTVRDLSEGDTTA